MAANLELARAAYDALVNLHPDGLNRDQLRRVLKADDRSARDAVNGCRTLAAQLPHPSNGRLFVIGFDPQTGLYCAARDAHTARRIIAYQEVRVEDINRAVTVQKEAFEKTFGQRYRPTEEIGLF